MALPGILSISFSSVKSEVILHALELSEIYVSSGSACSAKKNSISHVIKAMNIPAPWSDGTIRFSFSGDNRGRGSGFMCPRPFEGIS